MKIGMIADVHFRATKNIFDRLEMCKQSLLWAYQQFEKENVDFIVNLGDLYDSSVVSAETIQAVSEVYKQHPDIKEYVVSGNHDSFNYLNTVVSHLSIHEYVEVITDPERYSFYSFLPYRKTKDITGDLLKKLSNDILFSHIDINRSSSGSGFRLPGVDPEVLSDNFGHVFNGHIHHGEMINQTVSNVGSLVCHSFSDKPMSTHCLSIYDSESKTTRYIENPFSYYFETVKASSTTDFLTKLKHLQMRERRIVLKVIVPANLREFVKEVLLTKNFIHTRVLVEPAKETKTDGNNKQQSISQIDLEKEFNEFLSTVDKESLKGPLDQYRKEVLSD